MEGVESKKKAGEACEVFSQSPSLLWCTTPNERPGIHSWQPGFYSHLRGFELPNGNFSQGRLENQVIKIPPNLTEK